MIKLIFGDKGNNYLFAAVSIIILYFVILLTFNWGFKWYHPFWRFISFVASIILVATRNQTIPIMTKKKVLLAGEETDIWIGPGFWFIPLFFSTAESEVQKVEKKDIVVPIFQCQDKKGKVLNVDANGDWKITETPEAEDRYKNQDAEAMPDNLRFLIKRTAERVCAKMIYKDEILGENVGEKVLEDTIFIRECNKYGIAFTNLLITAIAANLDQENLNAYHDELLEKEKSEYPVGHIFTHQELQDIEDRIQVKLKVARKIITNSALLGRYDVQ